MSDARRRRLELHMEEVTIRVPYMLVLRPARDLIALVYPQRWRVKFRGEFPVDWREKRYPMPLFRYAQLGPLELRLHRRP